jgi:hypothetical protein
MKILIRKYQGTIYPEGNGYTGAIDLEYDGKGNRRRIKRKGRTKEAVKDKLIKAVDDLELGIDTSDGYTARTPSETGSPRERRDSARRLSSASAFSARSTSSP